MRWHGRLPAGLSRRGDEPTGELDSDTTDSMLALIRRTHDELGCTFVIATHDQRLASIATRVVHLRDGMVQP